MGEGVVYYLPKTEIELQVIATKVVYTPGEFCQYADRYLRLMYGDYMQLPPEDRRETHAAGILATTPCPHPEARPWPA